MALGIFLRKIANGTSMAHIYFNIIADKWDWRVVSKKKKKKDASYEMEHSY